MVIAFQNNLGTDSVVIEVLEDCCYAYFHNDVDGSITGGTWLFNIGETPKKPAWEEGKLPPVPNSKEFVYRHTIQTPILESDFEVSFLHEDTEYGKKDKHAWVYFREEILGMVGEDMNPGFAEYASKSSPVAVKPDTDSHPPRRL